MRGYVSPDSTCGSSKEDVMSFVGRATTWATEWLLMLQPLLFPTSILRYSQ
jgi:hypothetical protein